MNHTTENLLRIEAIFHEALGATYEERPALIEARCGGDASLAAEVRSLLDACTAEESAAMSRRTDPFHGSGAAARNRIGPYEIDRLLGRGGMGAVYLAHRADGQFEQQVAIKLIDLPLATDIFRERFRMERQILAGLQHPFIARLLDGGVSAEGDLYLAMEYVNGVPIHRFCEAQGVSESQRLTLFVRVCEAVQFAHQNLVVHRDLKPDNILVAEDGTPRLLDFGTAKLLSPSVGKPGGDLTRQGFHSFTPQYASPEQVLGNPVTTASDTYSLGVLLYLLLTGSLPYELKELTIAEMLRVICNQAPRPPAEAAGPNRRISLDLQSILLKALRKEPLERYLTAEQFSSDIQAYLDGRPVGAREGTLRYRVVKFMRRHRLAVAGGALFATTLATGVGGVLWQSRVANIERRKAEARSADLRQLSNSLLSELDEAIKQLPGSTGVQKLLVTRVLEHLDRMATDPDTKDDRRTQLDLVDAYTRLGNIQGNGYDQNLGDTAGALVSLDKALAIAKPLAPSGSRDSEAIRALALAEQSRSEILWQTGNTPEAVSTMREALKSFDALVADPHVSPAQIAEVSAAHGTLGDELGQSGTASLGDQAGALTEYRTALDLDFRALALDPGLFRANRGVVVEQIKIGTIEMNTDPADALKNYQLGLKRVNAFPKDEQTGLIATRLRAMLVRKEANAMVELEEFNLAFPLFTEVVQTQQQLAAADPQDSRSLEDLEIMIWDEAAAYESASDPHVTMPPADRRQNLKNAERLFTQTVAMMQQILKRDPSSDKWKALLANTQVHIGTIQEMLHTPRNAETVSKRSLAILKEAAKKEDAAPMVLDLAVDSFVHARPASLRDPQFAVVCAEREATLSHRKDPLVLLSLAQAYHAAGQRQRMRAAAQEGLSMLPSPEPGTPKSRLRKLLETEASAAN
jgi:tetratricopeptide (TPR) repeat protein